MNLRDAGIGGCIFDFDGTVILSEHVHMKAWDDLANHLGEILPPGFVESTIGLSDWQLIGQLAKAWQGRVPEPVIHDQKRKFYLERSRTECELVPGVDRALRGLRDARVPVALATSSSEVEVMPILEFFELRNCFHAIHTVESVRHPKPDPEIYLNASKSIGLSPDRCLVFEDSPAGVSSARAAGTKLVILTTTFKASDLGECWFSIPDFNHPRVIELLA